MSGLSVDVLKLSHFRSHKRAVAEFDGRPVAIYGPNGAGKTNILEAISLLSPGRGLRRAAAEDMIRKQEALGWKISAEITSLHQFHEVETWMEPDKGRQLRIDGKAAPQVALGRIARVLWLVPSMDRLWIEGADGRRRFLDRMTMSFEPSHAEAVLTYEKAMRERNRLLKDQVRDAHWYKVLEMHMAETGHAIHIARSTALDRILKAQKTAQTAFPTAELTLEHPDGIFPETVDDLKTALSENRARDLAAGRTLIGPHRTDMIGVFQAKGIPARDCSTGEQKALLVSMILANARALAQDLGSAPIILLDEVAAHLDAGRRRALYDEICALGAQAWMTGTEIDLFSDLGARAQYFEITEADSISSVSAFGS